MTELILAAVLAAAVVVFVAVPFLREQSPERTDEPRSESLIAAEERDRALAELKELEFDHRTGKISDEDYRSLIQPLRRRVAHTLANGRALPDGTPEGASEQQFFARSPSSGRRDR